jgi:hypothetical protein
VKALLSPLDAYNKVKSSAGCSKSRDNVDNYLINTELASLGKKGALISDPTASPINGPGPISGGTVSVKTWLTVLMFTFLLSLRHPPIPMVTACLMLGKRLMV